MAIFNLKETCNGCGTCVENCPARALKMVDQNGFRYIYHSILKCARCGLCWRNCPQEAIDFREFMTDRWEQVEKFNLVTCLICGKTLGTEKQLTHIKEKVAGVEYLCEKCKKRSTARKQVLTSFEEACR